MLKVSFLHMTSILNSVVEQKIDEAIKSLMEKDNHIEFLFTNCRFGVENFIIHHIMDLRNEYPDHHLDIILIEDPIKLERMDTEMFKHPKEQFPRGAITRIESAPRIEGKSETHSTRFIEHAKKVERWIASQCDYIIVYHYEAIPDSINTEVKRLRKKSKPEIISLNDPQIDEFINQYIDNLEERDGLVLRALRAGKTYRSIASELEITPNRVQQISHRATRYMYREIKKFLDNYRI